MPFNSIEFLLFFPANALLYYLTPFRFRNMVLLLLSSIFYMSFIPAYIFVVIFVIVVDFYTAKFIERTSASKKILVTGIVINLLILAFFKYFVFAVNNFNFLFKNFNFTFHIPVFNFLLLFGNFSSNQFIYFQF